MRGCSSSAGSVPQVEEIPPDDGGAAGQDILQTKSWTWARSVMRLREGLSVEETQALGWSVPREEGGLDDVLRPDLRCRHEQPQAGDDQRCR